MAKQKSRSARWAEAVSVAQERVDDAISALGDLRDIQSEYEDWQGNLPESLQYNSAVAEKLQEVCDLEVDGAIGQVEEAKDMLGEAESVDLPQGFGRD